MSHASPEPGMNRLNLISPPLTMWLLLIIYGNHLSGIFIVGAKRTPFGTFGGSFTKTTSLELQEVAAKAALAAANVNPENVDSVVVGNVLAVSIFLSLVDSLDLLFLNLHFNNYHELPIPAAQIGSKSSQTLKK